MKNIVVVIFLIFSFTAQAEITFPYISDCASESNIDEVTCTESKLSQYLVKELQLQDFNNYNINAPLTIQFKITYEGKMTEVTVKENNTETAFATVIKEKMQAFGEQHKWLPTLDNGYLRGTIITISTYYPYKDWANVRLRFEMKLTIPTVTNHKIQIPTEWAHFKLYKNSATKKQDTEKALGEFLYHQLKKESKITETKISFQIDQEGILRNIQIASGYPDSAFASNIYTALTKSLYYFNWKPTYWNNKAQKTLVKFNIPLKLIQLKKLSLEMEIIQGANDDRGAHDFYNDMIFMVVEDRPRFPGCADIVDRKEARDCSNKNLLKYIYQHLVLAPPSREELRNNLVVVSFVIKRDGTIEDAQIIKDIGTGYGNAAILVVEKMNFQGLKWQAGRQRNQPVKVKFNLPVRFGIR